MLRRVVESSTKRLLRQRNGALARSRSQQPKRGFAVDAKVSLYYFEWLR